jgi:nitroreductase
MRKPAETDHPVHDLVRERWSPYWFTGAPIPAADLRSVLEAARWAPSSYNEQPWTYLVAARSDEVEFPRMLSCLIEGNQGWAESAAVLMLGVTGLHRGNGDPNRAAQHDLGLASATLSFEAGARGIAVHQMSGILPDRIRELYAIPDTHLPLTALALGYPAPLADAPERLRERHDRPRLRNPQSSFVYTGTWGRPASL